MARETTTIETGREYRMPKAESTGTIDELFLDDDGELQVRLEFTMHGRLHHGSPETEMAVKQAHWLFERIDSGEIELVE